MDSRKLVICFIACFLLVSLMPPIALAQNTADGDGVIEPGENKTEELAKAAQGEGVDAIELNYSCPHMDRADMGSGLGKDAELVSTTTQAVKEVATVPVWAKLTPATLTSGRKQRRPSSAEPTPSCHRTRSRHCRRSIRRRSTSRSTSMATCRLAASVGRPSTCSHWPRWRR